MTSSVMTKPMFSDVKEGSFKEMWKDPTRIDKWLLQPNEYIKFISIRGEHNEEYYKIDIKEYNRIQNEAQIIFCSANDWPSYCISYLSLKSDGKSEHDIISVLKDNFSQ